MKRHFKIFFLLLSLLSVGSIAKCAGSANHLSRNLINYPHISYAASVAGMNGNRPTSERQLLLFRNGVDEKGILFSPSISQPSSLCLTSIPDIFLLNSGKVRFILTFSTFLALPPEFLSSSSFRSPPVLC